MSHRILVACAVFLASCAIASAQNSQTVLPYDSEVVSLLKSIYLEQGKDPLSTAGPFSVRELQMMLDKIDPSSLSPAGMQAYAAIKEKLATKPADKPMALKFAAHPAASVEGYYHTNDDADTTEWQEGYNDRLPLVTIPTDIWIGDYVYADFDATLRQNHDALNPKLVSDNYLNWTTDFDILDYNIPQRAFAAFGGDDWSFSIGRDRFSWGNGETGNLMISDAPDFEDFARLTLYWPWIKYSALWITLPYNKDSTYNDPIQGGNTDTSGTYPRNFFVHRLDLSLWDRLSLSASEGILVGGVEPDLVYLNPLIIFHDLYRWGHASSILSVEASYNPWRYFELYGQAAYNQIQTPYELIRYGTGASDVPGAAAYLGGVRSRVPVWMGYIDAGAEAVLVQPWMYLRENKLISYEWWRYMASNVDGSHQWASSCLGYFTGPDAIVFACWLQYDVTKQFSVRFDYKRIEHGEQDFNTTYSDSAAAAALVTPTGTSECSDIFHLKGSYDPFPFLTLATNLYWISVENYGNEKGASMKDFQASVSATVHVDL